ncbi:MAG: YkvA family protein [Eubacterium sp.]
MLRKNTEEKSENYGSRRVNMDFRNYPKVHVRSHEEAEKTADSAKKKKRSRIHLQAPKLPKMPKMPEIHPLTKDQMKRKVSDFVEPYKEEAEDIVNHKESMEELLLKADQKLKEIPKYGRKLAYIPEMTLLLKSYITREYTDIGLPHLLLIIVALLYFVSPLNIIPDSIPGIGILDDALVAGLIMTWCRSDIDKYMKWLKKQQKEKDSEGQKETNKKEAADSSGLEKILPGSEPDRSLSSENGSETADNAG